MPMIDGQDLPFPDREQWHGTRGGYTNHRCRCEACTAANTEYHQRYMADPDHARKHNERRRNKRWNP